MKKSLLMALTASLVLTGVGTAFAADDAVKIDGSITFHYRTQHDPQRTGDKTRNSFKSTVTLNAEAPIASNLDAYARFTYQNISKDEGLFARDYIDGDKNNAAIDAFGLKYKNAGYSYVVGSQALTLGGGIAYDNGFIGQHALPYAINGSKKVGAVNLNAIAAKTNYQDNKENDKFYVLQGTMAVSDKSTVGAMLAQVNYGENTVADFNLKSDDVTFFSVYGTRQLSDRTSLSAEYLKSSVSYASQGVQANVTRKLDDKNKLTTGIYYIQDQANIFDDNFADMTTSPNNNAKGTLVVWNHKFNESTSLTVGNLNYKVLDKNSTSGAVSSDRNRFFTNVSVKF